MKQNSLIQPKVRFWNEHVKHVAWNFSLAKCHVTLDTNPNSGQETIPSIFKSPKSFRKKMHHKVIRSNRCIFTEQWWTMSLTLGDFACSLQSAALTVKLQGFTNLVVPFSAIANGEKTNKNATQLEVWSSHVYLHFILDVLWCEIMSWKKLDQHPKWIQIHFHLPGSRTVSCFL